MFYKNQLLTVDCSVEKRESFACSELSALIHGTLSVSITIYLQFYYRYRDLHREFQYKLLTAYFCRFSITSKITYTQVCQFHVSSLSSITVLQNGTRPWTSNLKRQQSFLERNELPLRPTVYESQK